MSNSQLITPDLSAIGSASLRAMHVQFDPEPHIFDDELGLKLVSPDGSLNFPPGMTTESTKGIRASIVARARFIEDLVTEEVGNGVRQYIILGAGLDTFAQRQQDLSSSLSVFEVDRPGPQIWKKQRLVEIGFDIPKFLNFVPVDFDAGNSWWNELINSGFNSNQKSILSCTGVSMYLTKETVMRIFNQCAMLTSGSTLVMSFALPPELIKLDEFTLHKTIEVNTQIPATTFSPQEILHLANQAGFKKTQYISAADLGQKYFSGRNDKLFPSSYQALIVAVT